MSGLGQLQRDIARRLLYAFWGMLTLVLIFCVVLLVRQLRQQGVDPVAALQRIAAPGAPAAPAAAAMPGTGEALALSTPATLGPRPIKLYFAEPARSALGTQAATIEYGPATTENVRAALAQLIAGPAEGLLPVAPPGLQVRALYRVDGGELVIDFSRELYTAHTALRSAALEALFVYGVVYTVTQPELLGEGDTPVQRVRFLVEGAAPLPDFPAHLDLGAPVAPDRRWLAEEAAPAHG